MYIAHKSEDGRIQSLRDHLEGVSGLAGEFAEWFKSQEHGKQVGLLHDIGKYSSAGQRRMNDPEHAPKVDHSTAGAVVAWNMKDLFGAIAIAGHHGGLMDIGSKGSVEGDGTLKGRLKKDLKGNLDYGAYQKEIRLDTKPPLPPWLDSHNAFSLQFYTRMLFSALVDADFIDTETFMQGQPADRGGGEDMTALRDRLMAHVKPWLDGPGDGINGKRNEILRSCIHAGSMSKRLYTLTVPTGGGKTVSSLAFALTHAALQGLRRVIYVIPYTSIIEQNAKVFSDILGEDNVLEHHSAVDFSEGRNPEDVEDPNVRRKMLATENWDAPVVVTTAVQFFESLFAAKTSRCRRLHNIAGSVVIFDEAQMLPLPYLKPCVAAIGELVQHYNVTAVLCTATQPSLKELFRQSAPELPSSEICRDPAGLTAFFKRTRYVQEGKMDKAGVAARLTEQDQTLCVVNLRRSAKEIFEMLPKEGRFHLSTRMTPIHRERVLETIRNRLREGKGCRVVSTSLIEAGVDVDFPQVWREKAGLDSVIQAGGRCNREGKRRAEDSLVHVFSLENGVHKMIRQNVTAMEMAEEAAERAGRDLDDPATIKAYFDNLLNLRGEGTDANGIMEKCERLALRRIDEAFHLIEQDTVPIYIPSQAMEEDMARLRGGDLSRGLMRRLGRCAVNVYRNEWRALWEAGKLKTGDDKCGFLEDDVREGKFGILEDETAYSEEYGLNVETEQGNGFWA